MAAMTSPASAFRSTQLPALLGWLLVSLAAGAVGAIASADAGSFYQQLARPAWAPPPWIFAPVWSVLYVLMGLAAWLVWRERMVRATRAALVVFVVQLLANALWTWLFFAWRQGALAFVEIVILSVLVLATVALFWRARPLAGALLLPYLAWVGFATALTWAMWRGNPALLA